MDAMNEDQVEFDTLWREVDEGRTHNPYLKGIDFVNVPDDLLRQLFTTSRVKDKAKAAESAEIPCPPLHLRRSIDQLRHWFNQLGPMQRADIASKGGDDPTMDQAREEASRIASTAGAYQHRKLQLNRL